MGAICAKLCVKSPCVAYARLGYHGMSPSTRKTLVWVMLLTCWVHLAFAIAALFAISESANLVKNVPLATAGSKSLAYANTDNSSFPGLKQDDVQLWIGLNGVVMGIDSSVDTSIFVNTSYPDAGESKFYKWDIVKKDPAICGRDSNGDPTHACDSCASAAGGLTFLYIIILIVAFASVKDLKKRGDPETDNIKSNFMPVLDLIGLLMNMYSLAKIGNGCFSGWVNSAGSDFDASLGASWWLMFGVQVTFLIRVLGNLAIPVPSENIDKELADVNDGSQQNQGAEAAL